ncbi:MAG: inositol 2-dehydrogenase [Promethearchaeota archaeon]|nr:MAG: inositol 2-dehydrogenase [Candidatus Lokiarchaeota archaeon]
MDKKFIVGVIGAGRIGAIHIENLLKTIPRVELKTVADIKLDSHLKQWATEIGIPNLTEDANEIFNDPEINAVIIASSTDTHVKFIQQAAKVNKHIFCEKPIDIDLKRTKETLKIVEDAGIKLMVGFNRRFDHNFKRIHDAVISGQIGKPQIIKITSRDPAPPPIEYIKISGGIFIDMTIHDWDMARYQAGSEVEEVFATGDVLIDPEIGEAGDIDTAVAILKFKNGAIGIIDNSRQAIYGYDQRVEVFGSEGCAIAENDTPNTVRIYNDENINSDKIAYFFLERYMDSYISELQHFFYCLETDQVPSPNGQDAVQDLLVALAAQKSFKENRPIKISEVDL